MQLSLAGSLTYSDGQAATNAGGISFSGDEWAYIRRVDVPVSGGISYFCAGSGAAGEPIRDWGNEVIECPVNRYKPAHTRVLFSYAT